MLPPLGNAGSPAGRTTPEITARIGATAPVPVWFVTAHDTAAAFSAVTAAARPEDRLTAVVACGSWAVAGVVLPAPLLTETARRRGFTQEIDRKSVVSGKSVSVRVDLGGRRIINKKKHNHNTTTAS